MAQEDGMASEADKLRYGEHLIDCAKAQAAFNQAKAKDKFFSKRLGEKLGSGPLNRILFGPKGKKNPQPFARIQYNNIKTFADICGVEIDYLSAAPDEQSALVGSSNRITFLPISGVNFVRLGSDNYEENAQFTFSVRFNLLSRGKPFVLLAFEALYIAPDGCYCFNGDKELLVNDAPTLTAGNDLDFRNPIPVDNGIVQIAYRRKVRPPLVIQTPSDCDYGDLRVRVHVLWDEAPEKVERFYRFEIGGDLTPINDRRPPPILSDRVLETMLAKNLITNEEFEYASRIDGYDRYQLVRFPTRITTVYPRDVMFLEVTPEFRAFFVELNKRAFENGVVEQT